MKVVLPMSKLRSQRCPFTIVFPDGTHLWILYCILMTDQGSAAAKVKAACDERRFHQFHDGGCHGGKYHDRPDGAFRRADVFHGADHAGISFFAKIFCEGNYDRFRKRMRWL